MKDKVFIGGNFPPKLVRDLKKIARQEHRSLNAQLEIFLLHGVIHHMERLRASEVITPARHD